MSTASAGTPDRVSVGRRHLLLGSVFGKSIGESRRAVLIMGSILGAVLIGLSYTIVSQFATPESRRQIADLIRSVPPIMQGLAGRPVRVETLGGYMHYKYGAFFPLVVGFWSILALSATLAGEAGRGSLEFLAATGVSRRRIAIAKLTGHVVMLGAAMLAVFGAIAYAGSALNGLPGDEIGWGAAASYATWLGLLALAAGALAFALAPFFGRSAARGIAGAVMFAGFILNGYQAAVPSLAPFANLTWFGWTSNHIPLAGQFDWPAMVAVAVVTIALFIVGVETFARRDLGAISPLPSPRLPRFLAGLRGPAGRAFGHGLPSALAWGMGLGFFGLLLAASGGAFVDQLTSSPDFVRLLARVFPNTDFANVGGFLQLLFFEFGLVLAGLSAASLVRRWGSDETTGRLELLLASPLARRRWFFGGGLAVLGGTAVIVILAGVGITIGALIAGGEVVTPMAGTLVLGLFAVAVAGLGFAGGGLFGSAAAGSIVTGATSVFWFIDIFGPALELPEVVQNLALPAHYGQPMVGQWHAAGIVASLVLAIGGLAVGAWGFARRDLRT